MLEKLLGSVEMNFIRRENDKAYLVAEFLWIMKKHKSSSLKMLRDYAKEQYKKVGRGVVLIHIDLKDAKTNSEILGDMETLFIGKEMKYVTPFNFDETFLALFVYLLEDRELIGDQGIKISPLYIKEFLQASFQSIWENVKAYEPRKGEYNLGILTVYNNNLVIEIGTLDKQNRIYIDGKFIRL